MGTVKFEDKIWNEDVEKMVVFHSPLGSQHKLFVLVTAICTWPNHIEKNTFEYGHSLLSSTESLYKRVNVNILDSR